MMLRNVLSRACVSCSKKNTPFIQPSTTTTTTPLFSTSSNLHLFKQQHQQYHLFRSISTTHTSLYTVNANQHQQQQNNNNSVNIGGEEVVELIDAEFEESSSANETTTSTSYENEIIDAEELITPSSSSSTSETTNNKKQQPNTRPFERPNVFAVIQTGGKQYKVAPGDLITVDKIPVDVDTQVKFQKVLLVGGSDYTAVGRPIIPQSYVTGTVCEQKRAAHVIVFKKKRRKGYRTTRGHRQLISVVRIDDIELSGEVNEQNGREERVVAVE